ncbi:hypothetical protein [Floridanema aerugineum]|jgi:hydrogenase nickel incorporation protein HypB|uniref:Uncharacterized protein n=1 Tax=Floridaenema aerugineum BLCC-F46 TaxID=3153654 RepID=A0ABV4X0Z4_9CYAN
MFQTVESVNVNKVDIDEVVEFNRELAIANIKRVVPQATTLEVSARTDWQMETFYSCLEEHITHQFTTNVFSH